MLAYAHTFALSNMLEHAHTHTHIHVTVMLSEVVRKRRLSFASAEAPQMCFLFMSLGVCFPLPSCSLHKCITCLTGELGFLEQGMVLWEGGLDL